MGLGTVHLGRGLVALFLWALIPLPDSMVLIFEFSVVHHMIELREKEGRGFINHVLDELCAFCEYTTNSFIVLYKEVMMMRETTSI